MENILRWYDMSSSTDRSHGRGWYQYARQECQAVAEYHDADHQRVVWATAALSPQLRWETNIKAVNMVLSGTIKVPGAYPANVEKALHILNDPDDWQRWLSGPKVSSFARNIWGDPDAVTVDTWAWRIWAGADLRAQPKGLNKLYGTIADDYRAAAAEIGLEARQLQAITWVTIRRVANGRAAPGQLSLDI